MFGTQTPSCLINANDYSFSIVKQTSTTIVTVFITTWGYLWHEKRITISDRRQIAIRRASGSRIRGGLCRAESAVVLHGAHEEVTPALVHLCLWSADAWCSIKQRHHIETCATTSWANRHYLRNIFIRVHCNWDVGSRIVWTMQEVLITSHAARRRTLGSVSNNHQNNTMGSNEDARPADNQKSFIPVNNQLWKLAELVLTWSENGFGRKWNKELICLAYMRRSASAAWHILMTSSEERLRLKDVGGRNRWWETSIFTDHVWFAGAFVAPIRSNVYRHSSVDFRLMASLFMQSWHAYLSNMIGLLSLSLSLFPFRLALGCTIRRMP